MATPKGITIKFLDRDYQEANDLPNLIYTPNRYSFEAVGGPKEATVVAFGSEYDLWRLVTMLRYNIFFNDYKKDTLWWGYISEIIIRVGNIKFGVSLDEMYNYIAVAYTSFGERNTTSWASDSTSINEYGTKELLITVSDAIENEANARRDSELENKKLPIPTVDFQSQTEGSLSAEIKCRGWHETLGWKYYSQEKGLVQHASGGVGTQNVGAIYTSACVDFDGDTGQISDWNENLSPFEKGEILSINSSASNDGNWIVSQGTSSGSNIKVEETLTTDSDDNSVTLYTASRIAQSFYQSSGSSWDASMVHIRAQTTGSPVDDLVISLHSQSAGSPWTELASGSVSASDLDETMQWREIPLSSCATLANNTTYWLQIDRSGVPTSASIHYKIDVDEGLGYGNGELLTRTYQGWVSRATDADMLFKVVGTQPITDQIKEIANTSGQFFSGVTIDDASTIETNQYRDGETTALTEVSELLKVGTANNRRLLCNVTKERRLKIYEEPAQGKTSDYKMQLNGSVKDNYNQEVPKKKCTVAKWIKISDFQPVVLDKTLIANPTLFFIEEADYYIQGDQYTPRSKNTDSFWNIGKIKDG